jgi:hypothetical protein
MFKVAMSTTPMFRGGFAEWTLQEMLESVCTPSLTAVIRFLPSGIELLLDKGQLVSARGGIKLSQVLVQEGVMTKQQLQGAGQLAPTLLEALTKLNVPQTLIRQAIRTQLILTLKFLQKQSVGEFEVFSAIYPGSSLSAALGLYSALGEVRRLQETEAATQMSHATIERLIDHAPFEIEMQFDTRI